MLTSNSRSVSLRDFWRALIMAVGAPILTQVYDMVNSWSFTVEDWRLLVKYSASTFILYILKNYFTNDVPNAIKTIEKAGGEVTPKLNNQNN